MGIRSLAVSSKKLIKLKGVDLGPLKELRFSESKN